MHNDRFVCAVVSQQPNNFASLALSCLLRLLFVVEVCEETKMFEEEVIVVVSLLLLLLISQNLSIHCFISCFDLDS